MQTQYLNDEKEKHVMLKQKLTMRMATKHAMVVFQSPYDEALPTRTL